MHFGNDTCGGGEGLVQMFGGKLIIPEQIFEGGAGADGFGDEDGDGLMLRVAVSPCNCFRYGKGAGEGELEVIEFGLAGAGAEGPFEPVADAMGLVDFDVKFELIDGYLENAAEGIFLDEAGVGMVRKVLPVNGLVEEESGMVAAEAGPVQRIDGRVHGGTVGQPGSVFGIAAEAEAHINTLLKRP